MLSVLSLRDKGWRIYDINYPIPTITRFGNILIRQDGRVRYLSIGEMARASSFSPEQVRQLENLTLKCGHADIALKYIANAVAALRATLHMTRPKASSPWAADISTMAMRPPPISPVWHNGTELLTQRDSHIHNPSPILLLSRPGQKRTDDP